MVAPLLILGGLTLASIVGPPIVDWIGKQTWNQQAAQNETKIADAAAYDQWLKQQAQAGGAPNPYAAPTIQQTSTTDPMASFMPMMMMMMLIPMMQNMTKSSNDKERDDYD